MGTEQGKSKKEVRKVRKYIKRKEAKDREMAKGGEKPSQMRSMLLAGMDHGGLPAFLAGSMLFAFSAAAASPAIAQATSTAGLSCFLLGRVLFLEASQTDLCDVLFRTNWRFNCLTHQW